MSEKKDVESEGSTPRDHVHPRHQFWTHALRDWRVWCAAVLAPIIVGTPSGKTPPAPYKQPQILSWK